MVTFRHYYPKEITVRRVIAFCIVAALLCGCRSMWYRGGTTKSTSTYPSIVAGAVDAGGRPIRQLESGSTLFVSARGLTPNAHYQVRLGVGDQPAESLDQAVGFAIVGTDGRGTIPPFILWYESGVIGCAKRPKIEPDPRRFRFRSFDEAEQFLAGRTLTVSIHPVEREQLIARRPLADVRVEKAAAIFRLPVATRRSPMVYPSDRNGCLVNALQVRDEDDVYVSGRNFAPGTDLDISIVPNQRAWHIGDTINDVTGASSAGAREHVTVDASGRFTVRAWDRANERRGAYDIVAHDRGQPAGRISSRDVISFASETGLILFLLYPPGGSTMDIAGRPLPHFPYFEYADSFADTNDPVWGAVDPTYVPAGHTGGTWAAYYVVNHRDVAGWDPGMGGATNLVDVSGGFEVHMVKAGCINGTDVPIWNPPLAPGQYDVVVDFGSTVATSAAQFMTDSNYDSAIDFLDGANQIGFIVAADPYAFGSHAVGQDEYSVDDFFPTLGSRTNVDLRGVIRYPATAPGVSTPVEAGQHPIFIIEHGNHITCRQAGFDGNASYDAVHTGCPTRVENHKGYMGLLDRLASQGVIAVSIDAYDLTGFVPQLNAERSDLILKHLELWSHMHDHSLFTSYPDLLGNRFVGHVDLSKISISGHSRGGEASVGAFIRNMGTFNIGSVSSIAPVDGVGHVLPDVPYFVILPAADGDVADLGGQRIYDRAGTATNLTTKSAIDVYGASHNFFNTVWAADGDDGDAGRADFIPAADQQRLGEAWLGAFARVHLTGETVYDDMLRGKLDFPSFAGRKIYPERHEKNFAAVENGGNSGTAASTATVTAIASPPRHQSAAIKVAWSSGAGTLTYSIGPMDVTAFEVLSFRVAQTNAASNPAGSQEFSVELVGGGKTRATYTGQFGEIPHPYHHISWMGTIDEALMTTIRVPLHSFIVNQSGVTLNNIDTVRFRFNAIPQGEIYVDDIEFSR
jgi:hypothetical protein